MGPGQKTARLTGIEISSGERSAVTCAALSKLPKIGEGLVIPKDNRFIDLDQEEGELRYRLAYRSRSKDHAESSQV
jgi:hypothetical protein